MNLVNSITTELKKHSEVALEGFGVFFLRDTTARFSKESEELLPPSRVIDLRIDYQTQDEGFTKRTAQNESRSVIEIKNELEKLTTFWKNQLLANDAFTIEGLGQFKINDSSLVFEGEPIGELVPHLYGLEQINLKEIHKSSKKSSGSSEPYARSNSWGWKVFFVVSAVGLLVLAYSQKEILFGKKSELKQKSTDKKLVKKVQTSAALPKVDSIK